MRGKKYKERGRERARKKEKVRECDRERGEEGVSVRLREADPRRKPFSTKQRRTIGSQQPRRRANGRRRRRRPQSAPGAHRTLRNGASAWAAALNHRRRRPGTDRKKLIYIQRSETGPLAREPLQQAGVAGRQDGHINHPADGRALTLTRGR